MGQLGQKLKAEPAESGTALQGKQPLQWNWNQPNDSRDKLSKASGKNSIYCKKREERRRYFEEPNQKKQDGWDEGTALRPCPPIILRLPQLAPS